MSALYKSQYKKIQKINPGKARSGVAGIYVSYSIYDQVCCHCDSFLNSSTKKIIFLKIFSSTLPKSYFSLSMLLCFDLFPNELFSEKKELRTSKKRFACWFSKSIFQQFFYEYWPYKSCMI